MSTKTQQIQLDRHQHSARLNGVVLPLQDKAWRVLSILVDRAPQTVSRKVLVDEVWDGNYATGDKGLNQALWAIRMALGDDARSPAYIRTISRKGYQWISEPVVTGRPILTRNVSRATAAGVLIMLSGALSISAGNNESFQLPAQCLTEAGMQTSAALVDRDVIISIQGGCRLIVKPLGSKTFGKPLVSGDGEHVAFTVNRASRCELVTIALRDGKKNEFGVCPHQ